MIDGEELLTNKRVRIIKLCPNRVGERALMRALKSMKTQSLKVVWGSNGDMRLVIPTINDKEVPDGNTEPGNAE